MPKKVTDKKPTKLSFLCCHNKCAQFHLENCNALDNCCHQYWTINLTASYSCLAFLRCCFLKMENRRDSDAPQIALKWSRYVDTTRTGNRDISSAMNGFVATTIGTRRLKKIHRGRRLPRFLIGTKKAKEIKKKIDYFNENIFKNFWKQREGKFFINNQFFTVSRTC